MHQITRVRMSVIPVVIATLAHRLPRVKAFTAPHVLIEGVFVVHDHAAIHHQEEVDRAGTRIGVKPRART